MRKSTELSTVRRPRIGAFGKLARIGGLAGTAALVLALVWVGVNHDRLDRPAPAPTTNGALTPVSPPAGSTTAAPTVGDGSDDGAIGKLLQVGKRFRDCPMCPEVVVVRAGSYTMGSPDGQPGREEREGPPHEVTLAARFAIGVYEVKVSEFRSFVDEEEYSVGSSCLTLEESGQEERDRRSWREPGFPQDDEHPVVCVNWHDAQAYVAWLSQKTGESYRLPTEAEWEYAARADTTTVSYWSQAADQCRSANGADRSIRDYWEGETAPCDDGFGKTSPVGNFAANAWGLADVLGNVYEWTMDCWNSNYAGAPLNGDAWQDGDCSRRVARGGSWLSEPSRLRVADRRWTTSGAAMRSDEVGFRVARTVGSKQEPAGTHALTVRTGPPSAHIEIVNIMPPYRPGMELSPGNYYLRVTAPGFETVERTLRHSDEPTNAWIGLPFRDCPGCPMMIEIPRGSYRMGASAGPERFPEGPAHDVAIQAAIAVGVHEVSRKEWEACDERCSRIDGSGGLGGLPVVSVSVGDVENYTKWLSDRTRRRYRLLSEAEWEWAARAGSRDVRCADPDSAPRTATANYSDFPVVACTDSLVHAAPGREERFKPNAWGLYHMLGNASEWTADCWHDDYNGAPTDGSAWTRGCASSGDYVLRGGSWRDALGDMRAGKRFKLFPRMRRDDVGFRVAVEIGR